MYQGRALSDFNENPSSNIVISNLIIFVSTRAVDVSSYEYDISAVIIIVEIDEVIKKHVFVVDRRRNYKVSKDTRTTYNM